MESSQAVALQDLLAALAKLFPMLLKALGHSHVVTQLLSAETRGVSGACLLLLRCSHMLSILSKTIRGCQQKRDNDRDRRH